MTMGTALTVALLAWYFVVLDNFQTHPGRVGPFPTREVCESIRAFVLGNAPDRGVPPQQFFVGAEGRITPCWMAADQRRHVETLIPEASER